MTTKIGDLVKTKQGIQGILSAFCRNPYDDTLWVIIVTGSMGKFKCPAKDIEVVA